MTERSQEQAVNELLKLAERCEAATGPDNKLNFDIWAALNGVTEITTTTSGRVEGKDKDGDWRLFAFVDGVEGFTPYGPEDRYPLVTESLDAAMTLVPSTHYWAVGTIAQDGYEHYDDMDFAWAQTVHREGGNSIDVEYAATSALALCAASLRARAAQ